MQRFENTALNPYLDGLYPNSIDGHGPLPETIIMELRSRVEIVDRNFASFQAAMERAKATSESLLAVARQEFATMEKDPISNAKPDIGLIAAQSQKMAGLISETEEISRDYLAAQSEMRDESTWLPKFWSAIFKTPPEPHHDVAGTGGDSADPDPRTRGAREALDAVRSARARQSVEEGTTLARRFEALLQARRDIEMLLMAAELRHDLHQPGRSLETVERVAKAVNARFSEAFDRFESAKRRFSRRPDDAAQAPTTADPWVRREIETADAVVEGMMAGIDSALALIRAAYLDPVYTDAVKKDAIETVFKTGEILLDRLEIAHGDFTFTIRDSRAAAKNAGDHFLQYVRKLTGISTR